MWGNVVELNAEGRIVHTGHNMEAGYLPGDDSSSFVATPRGRACITGDVGFWLDAGGKGGKGGEGGKLLCLEGRVDSVVKVLPLTLPLPLTLNSNPKP